MQGKLYICLFHHWNVECSLNVQMANTLFETVVKLKLIINLNCLMFKPHTFLSASARKDLILDSQHPSGFEKIQYLEDTSRYKKSEYVDEVVNVKPRFLTKPKSLENMREGQHAHFECKLEPVTDSNLKVEWYKNGRPITVGKYSVLLWRNVRNVCYHTL
jgi:hypothetical protein